MISLLCCFKSLSRTFCKLFQLRAFKSAINRDAEGDIGLCQSVVNCTHLRVQSTRHVEGGLWPCWSVVNYKHLRVQSTRQVEGGLWLCHFLWGLSCSSNFHNYTNLHFSTMHTWRAAKQGSLIRLSWKHMNNKYVTGRLNRSFLVNSQNCYL